MLPELFAATTRSSTSSSSRRSSTSGGGDAAGGATTTTTTSSSPTNATTTATAAEERKRQLKQQFRNAWFISGKFDQLRGMKPYSAISNAFQELAQILLTEYYSISSSSTTNNACNETLVTSSTGSTPPTSNAARTIISNTSTLLTNEEESPTDTLNDEEEESNAERIRKLVTEIKAAIGRPGVGVLRKLIPTIETLFEVTIADEFGPDESDSNKASTSTEDSDDDNNDDNQKEETKKKKKALPQKSNIKKSNSRDSNDDPSTKSSDDDNPNEVIGNKESLQQLKYVVNAFLKCICTKEHPLIFFLDDLQWIDMASLELLTSIWKDPQLNEQPFFFVGAYRDNEVPDVHPLFLAIRKLETEHDELQQEEEERRKRRGGVDDVVGPNANIMEHAFTKIQLDNLDAAVVNQILKDLLKLDPEVTLPLAQVIYQRTNGNIFFVLEYVKMLYEQNLLYFSTKISSYGWKWDTNQIVEDTNVADNVVDLIVSNFHKKLPPLVQDVLKITACLDSTFHSQVVWQIVKEEERESSDDDDYSLSTISTSPTAITKSTITIELDVNVSTMDDLMDLLGIAMKEGVIEKIPNRQEGWYKFRHDKFQQAAYSLLEDSEEERLALHYRIGRVLLPRYRHMVREGDVGGEEWRMLVAVDQLNKGSACIEGDFARIKLAKLNLVAGEMSARMSAYTPAMEYFDAGVEYLPKGEQKWKDQYQLTLDLLSNTVEIAYVNGDFAKADQLGDEIMKYATKDKMDKTRAAFTRVDSLGAQQKPDECFALAFDLLRNTLEEPFPKKINLFHIIRNFMKTQRMLKQMSDGELLSLPVMTDTTKIAAMKLMASISTHAYFAFRLDIMAMMNFRMMQLSIQYGVGKLSPAAFARYGLLLCAMKDDIKSGYRFGKLGLTLLDQLGAREYEAQVICIANQFLSHWQEPISNITEPLLQAYQSGLERGDVEFAMLSCGGYALVYYHSGMKLGPMVKDLSGFCNQMKTHGQMVCYIATIPYLQGVLNLMGKTEEPLRLTGSAMNEDDVTRIATETNNFNALQNMWYFQAQIAYFLGQYDLALQSADKMRKTSDSVKAHVIYPNFIYLSGLIYLALARQKKRRKYFVGARNNMKQLKKWVQDGAVNCFHKLKILEAQNMSLKRGKKADAVKLEFEKAINASARAGYLQDCAVAHNLLADYFHSINRLPDYEFHIGQAYAKFAEWGGYLAANHIVNVHSDVLSASVSSRTSFNTGVGMRARSRLSLSERDSSRSTAKSELLKASLAGVDKATLNEEGPGSRRNTRYGSKQDILQEVGESEYFPTHGSTVIDAVPEIVIPRDSVESRNW